MHHPTDRITHTTGFVTPVVEHWLDTVCNATIGRQAFVQVSSVSCGIGLVCTQWFVVVLVNIDSHVSLKFRRFMWYSAHFHRVYCFTHNYLCAITKIHMAVLDLYVNRMCLLGTGVCLV